MPLSGLGTPAVTKTITFDEPPGPAVIAFKGHASNEFQLPTLALKCVATRAASSWTFATTLNSGWVSVLSNSTRDDSFAPNWFSKDYTGPVANPTLSFGTPVALSGNTCGPFNVADKLRAPGPNHYFTFRREVVQYCNTFIMENTPAPINQDDLDGFNALRSALGSSQWTDCNSADPCSACSNNNAQHAVLCETIAVVGAGRRLQASRERRIVVLRLRNLNLNGQVPFAALRMMTSAREINLGNTVGAPNPNVLSLPSSNTCVDVPRCSVSGVTCDFDTLPVCASGAARDEAASTSTNVAVVAGVAVAAMLLVGVVVLLVVRARRRSSGETASQPVPTAVPVVLTNDSGPPEDEPINAAPPRKSLSRSFSLGRKKSSAASPWKELMDEATGARYWMNTITGEFSWSAPHLAGDEPARDPEIVELSQQAPVFTATSHLRRSVSSKTAKFSVPPEGAEQWREAAGDGSGHKYWVNASTGQFVYDNAAVPKGATSGNSKQEAWSEMFDDSSATKYWVQPEPEPAPAPAPRPTSMKRSGTSHAVVVRFEDEPESGL